MKDRISLYQLRQLISAYDKEEVSLGRLCEILNGEGQPNHINEYGKLKTAYPLPQTGDDVWLTAITRAHRFADKDKRENNLSDDEREESFVGYLISNYSIKKL